MFKTDYFFRVIDQSLESMKTRFEQYNQHFNNFGFLYNTKQLDDMTNDDLLKSCKDLDLLLQRPSLDADSLESRDIVGVDLYHEMLLFRDFLSANNLKNLNAVNTLNALKGNTASFPNLSIALRILLTMPVTVASAERSFSKLKQIKNYLRTTMSQQRLCNLAIITIENDIYNDLDVNELIKNFASVKVRKVSF